jgi:hypothetical protein
MYTKKLESVIYTLQLIQLITFFSTRFRARTEWTGDRDHRALPGGTAKTAETATRERYVCTMLGMFLFWVCFTVHV